jgi:hypothetical protein
MNGEPKVTAAEIPPAPEVVGALAPLPEAKRREWRDTYAKALKQAKIDVPEDGMEQRTRALKEANRMFRVEEPLNYKDAMALEPWQVMKRQQEGERLHVVLIDSRGHFFPVPRGVDAAADLRDGKDKGSAKDKG